ncbi:HPr family phosphocarrier protein [Sporomusa acidovorans]|uniref:Phosphocarrier protein HPr n=1 Tax=Sporomusa acidovorans (strain ATCC 49682 / DSM 3132 / Mol) TaxID=1123286 RepID=A0ABZ3JCF8_SPOA4|nr:HPr family phosphocarrier protein [Sporomusa acidovorans]OZC22708.1 phosphocarrier protein HPr [Sporomusa acidovorans DSM 3132]SDE79452.1 phosphocarrier protein [Sporomusa acidovorans]
MTKIDLVLANAAGLHARPAAQFVQTAAGFMSKVTIRAGEKAADAKSILAVMGLGLGRGASFELTADGSDEAECIAVLQKLVTSNFGEG